MACSPLATTRLTDQYEASWVDSFHNNTAIMFCVGTATENGFSVLGSYPDPTGGPDWGWRTEVELWITIISSSPPTTSILNMAKRRQQKRD